MAVAASGVQFRIEFAPAWRAQNRWRDPTSGGISSAVRRPTLAQREELGRLMRRALFLVRDWSLALKPDAPRHVQVSRAVSIHAFNCDNGSFHDWSHDGVLVLAVSTLPNRKGLARRALRAFCEQHLAPEETVRLTLRRMVRPGD